MLVCSVEGGDLLIVRREEMPNDTHLMGVLNACVVEEE